MSAPADDSQANHALPAGGQSETSPPPQDKGMSAVAPVLAEAEFANLSPFPEEAVPLPPATAMQGAPSVQPLEPAGGTAPMDLLGTQQLLTADYLRGLWARVDQAQSDIRTYVHSRDIALELMARLQNARNDLLAGPGRYDDAERSVGEVEFRIAQSRRLTESYPSGIRVFFYEIVMFALLLLAMVFLTPWFFQLITRLGGPGSPAWPADTWETDFAVAFSSMLWGGIGGVSGALYYLWRHLARSQDFDQRYVIWYITNPIMGVIVGMFVFLIVRAGIFSLMNESSPTISSPLVIYALAWISGFQQNVVYDIVRRILKVFRLDDSIVSQPSDIP